MAEVGKVVKMKDEFVVIALERKEACASCRACTLGSEGKEMILEAENKCNAKIGDTVGVSLEQSNFLLAVIIMYTIPLIGLLLGIGTGYLVSVQLSLGNKEILALIFGFAFLAISYLGIKLNEPKFKTKRFRPVAEEIIIPNENE